MRKLSYCLLAFALMLFVTPAAALVEARIQISTQRMTVEVDGALVHDWAVSTGRRGYDTPTGRYRPQWLAARYFSRKYDNAPMPHAIFFSGGYAVHGTTETRRLGRPASHGCVRLHPRQAAELFALVRSHGVAASRIVIVP